MPDPTLRPNTDTVPCNWCGAQPGEVHKPLTPRANRPDATPQPNRPDQEV